MRKLAVIVAASALLAPAAWAQGLQGLGAADPSQQLKTSGMNTFQSQTTTLQREERKEPLVSGTAEASGEAQASPSAKSAPARAPAPAAAPAPEPAPKPVPAADRGAMPAANTWNPVAANANASAGASAAVQQSAHMQRILDLVEQIRRRRDGK